MNRGFRYRSAARVDVPTPVADYLAAAFPHSDLATWTGRVARGEVSVDRFYLSR